jgi:hypothetical protein
VDECKPLPSTPTADARDELVDARLVVAMRGRPVDPVDDLVAVDLRPGAKHSSTFRLSFGA